MKSVANPSHSGVHPEIVETAGETLESPGGGQWSQAVRGLAFDLWMGPAGRNLATVGRLLATELYGGHQVPYQTLDRWKRADDWTAEADARLRSVAPYLGDRIHEAAMEYTLRGVHRLAELVERDDISPGDLQRTVRTLAEIAGVVGRSASVQVLQVNQPDGNGVSASAPPAMPVAPPPASLGDGRRLAIADSLHARLASFIGGSDAAEPGDGDGDGG